MMMTILLHSMGRVLTVTRLVLLVLRHQVIHVRLRFGELHLIHAWLRGGFQELSLRISSSRKTQGYKLLNDAACASNVWELKTCASKEGGTFLNKVGGD